MTVKTLGLRALTAMAKRLPSTTKNRIIYYHSVHPETTRSHRPDQFAAHLSLLKDMGYDFVALRDVPRRLRDDAASPWVCVTFDDGYADNWEVAAPILAAHGATATFFVVSSLIGRSSDDGNKLYPGRRMLSRQQLVEMSSTGFEVASHGHRHELASQLAATDPAGFACEVQNSRSVLEDIVQMEVRSFAYPNGQKGAHSAASREALERAGIRRACTTMWGAPTTTGDLLALPRCEVSVDDDVEALQQKMLGHQDFRRLYQNAFDRSVAW